VKLRAARADEVVVFVAHAGPLRAPREHFERAQRAGELLLAWDGQRLLGGVMATQQTPTSWRDCGARGALYLSHLSVAADHRGSGVGAAILAAVEARARSRGLAWLRLACAADDVRLARYYQGLGFYPRGVVDDAGARLLRLDRALAHDLPPAFRAERWATLLFAVDVDRVLLIRKLRGHGAGKVNAPGGMVEDGETFAECALRETAEEVGLQVDSATPLAELHFHDRDGANLLGLAFKTTRFSGSPVETAEATPFWSAIERLPFGEMWADDILWLPWLLDDQPVTGDFLMHDDRLLAHRLQPTTPEALLRLAERRR
jgi:8-oxo-dGTP diphosphatase